MTMSVICRPSIRELHMKISQAKSALEGASGLFANPAKAVGELYELEVFEIQKLWNLILELLDEIVPDDYKGSMPPQKSYEPNTEGYELFAFSWLSKKMSQKMYIKFALKHNRYYYISLHASRGGDYEMSTM